MSESLPSGLPEGLYLRPCEAPTPPLPDSILRIIASAHVSERAASVTKAPASELYFILLTLTGRGAMRHALLTPGTILFSPASSGIELSSSGIGWEYVILFLDKSDMLHSWYTLFLERNPAGIFRTSTDGRIAQIIQHLSAHPLSPTRSFCLLAAQYLTQILTLMSLPDADHPLSETDKKHMAPVWLSDLRNRMEVNCAMRFSLPELERSLGISRYRICREFKKYYGISPLACLNGIRMDRASSYLASTDLPVAEIAFTVGVPDTTHFINLFRQAYGMTPGAFRKSVRGG